MKIAPLLAAFLTIASVVMVIFPSAQAATTWHTENVGLTDTIGQFRLTPADSERVGMTYRFASGGAHKAWGFAIRSAGDAGTWSIKSADITSGYSVTAVYCVPQWLTGTIWIAGCQIAETTNCCNRIFRSTDDGVTWSNQGSLVINTNFGAPLPDTFVALGSKVAMLAFGNSISDTSEIYQTSSDNGVTWTTAINIGDNSGSPSGTATVTQGGGGGRIQYDSTTGIITASWFPGTKILGVQSTDGGNFWTVPYTSTANCNADAFCGTPGNNAFCEACPSVDGGTVTLTKSRFPTSGSVTGDIGYAAGGLYAWKDTSTGALLDVQAGASSTESPASACTTKGTVGSGRVAFEGIGSTWIAAQQCTTPNALNIYEKVGINSAWSTSLSIAGITTNDVAVTMTATKTYVAYTDSSVGGQVKVAWANTPQVSSALTSVNSATVTGLVGFDVDAFGNNVIARTNGGTTIRSFLGSSLVQLGSIASNCNRLDGVAALFAPTTTTGNPTPHNVEFLTYSDCSVSDTTHTNRLIIVDDHLNPPSQPTFCTAENSGTSTGGNANSGPFCSSQIQANSCGLLCVTNNNIPLPTQLGELKTINAARWDWSAATNANCQTIDFCSTQKYVTLSWGYSTDAGKVGLFQVVQNKNNPDSATAIEDTFSSSGLPSEICSWVDSSNLQNNIGAVQSAVSTKAWIARPGVSQSGSGLTTAFYQASPSLALESSFTNTYNNANAIDCRIDGFAAVQTSAGTYVIHMNGNQQGVSIGGPFASNGTPRGVALTRNEGKYGRFLATVTSASVVTLYNVTGNQAIGTVAMPTGVTFRGMKWDDAAQELFIATDATIANYDVHSLTTKDSIAEGVTVSTNNTRTCNGPDGLPSSDCSGVSDSSRSGLNGCGTVGQPACTSASQTSNIGGGTSNGGVAGLDVGGGIKTWAQSVGFVSDGSLFFFGLIFVAFAMIVGGASVSAFGGEKAGSITAGVLGLGTMIFNMLEAIWGIWTMAIMIVLTGAVLSIIIRKLFQPEIGSAA